MENFHPLKPTATFALFTSGGDKLKETDVDPMLAGPGAEGTEEHPVAGECDSSGQEGAQDIPTSWNWKEAKDRGLNQADLNL